MADSWEEHSGGDDGKLNPSAASFSFNPSVTSFVPSGVIPASSNDDITDSMAKVTIASPPQPIKEQEEEKKQEEEEKKKKKQEEEEEKRKQEEEEKKRKQEEEKQQQEEQEEEEDISKRQEIIQKVLEDLNAEDPREHMNVVFIGHVDAGKSTTAGQILFLTGGVDDRTIEKYEREAKEKNRESWYMAYIMDTNEEERAKGKTVEVGRAHFETKKKRYTILDAPGHKSFVPNMISGASQADIGVLVISARKGEFETGFERGGQTREHAQLAKTLGVSKLVVAINKMDDPSVVESGDAWSQARFDDIVAKLSPFLRGCGYNPKKDLIFIPISGLMGHNMKDSVDKNICPWYNGKPFFDILDEIDPISRDPFAPFRMPIMDKYKDMGTVVMGKCESGVVAKGDKLTMMPNKVAVKVTTVWRDEIEVQAARPGENLRLRLSGIEEDEISAGFVLSDPFKRVPVVHQFEAQIAVLDLLEHKPILTGGYTAILHLHSVVEECEVIKLVAAIDPKTKEKKKTKFVKSGSICIARIAVEKPICVESFDTNPQLGRFTLRDEGRTIAIDELIEYVPDSESGLQSKYYHSHPTHECKLPGGSVMKKKRGNEGLHPRKPSKGVKKMSTLNALKQKLQGSKFRWLNELMYTKSGEDSFAMIKETPKLFEEYHQGYREQTKQWPERPVDKALKWLSGRPKDWFVIDLGCGDAELSKRAPQTRVQNFDLAPAPNAGNVTVCNIASLPLQSSTVDVAIFCLSLMGIDYGSFIEEAARVLKSKGWLWIAEVQSRCIDEQGRSMLDDLVSGIESIGFSLKSKSIENSHFFTIVFQKQETRKMKRTSFPALRACMYKKR